MKMRRSKLESYEAILEVIVKKPLTLERIAYESSMDCANIKRFLGSLIKYDLIKEKFSGKKASYAITERGMSVFRILSFQKYLKKISKSLMTMDSTLQAVPILSEHTVEPKTKSEIE